MRISQPAALSLLSVKNLNRFTTYSFNAPHLNKLWTFCNSFTSWFGSRQQWPRQSILYLQCNLGNPDPHLHLIAVTLRIIWIRRNKTKFEGRIMSLREPCCLFKTELARVISATRILLLLFKLNLTQVALPDPNSTQQSPDSRTPAWPRFFSIYSFTFVVPTSFQ
jgi:hypothetical protein